MKSILDRSFQYVPAAETDLKKTFARLRREQRAEEAARLKIKERLHVVALASAKTQRLKRDDGGS